MPTLVGGVSRGAQNARFPCVAVTNNHPAPPAPLGCIQGRAGADHTTLSETIDRAACCPARKTRAYTCLGGDRRDFVTGGCWGSAGVGYRRPAVGAAPTAQPHHIGQYVSL